MRQRDEEGAVAVMVGIMVVLLFSVAAVTVDLGNAMMQRSETRKVTDFSALAGGGGTNLPGPLNGTCSTGYVGKRALSTGQAVGDVVANLTQTDWNVTPTATTLTDCNLSNGEVVYGRLTFPSSGTPTLTYNASQLTLYSPLRDVDFGLAGVMGFDGTQVGGQATVATGTPGGAKTFPSYAVDGCDWGLQTITNPANGQAASYVPTLTNPDTGTRVTLTASTTAAPNPSPNSIPVGTAAVPITDTVLTIHGTRLNEATQLGFYFEADGATPAGRVGPILPYNATTNPNGFVLVNNTTITLTISSARYPTITDVSRVLWVRVRGQSTGSASSAQVWSEASNAQPFSVGNAYLRCTSGSNQGNYGALILPRADSNNSTTGGWLPRNIATGLQLPLSLHTYPGSPTTIGGTSTAPDLCDPLDARTIYSITNGNPGVADLKPETNCVDTDPGLAANAVSAGLVEGVGTIKGRLRDQPSQCSRPLRTVTLTGNNQYSINDDVLTCFLQPGVTLGTIWSPGYTGPSVLSCDIYTSSRFFYQPVLQVRPGNGGSQHYSIVDFRPAFVTDQGSAAINGSGPGTVSNGVRVNNNAVDQIEVVFFNNNALNKDCPNVVGPSLGGTTLQALRLVD